MNASTWLGAQVSRVNCRSIQTWHGENTCARRQDNETMVAISGGPWRLLCWQRNEEYIAVKDENIALQNGWVQISGGPAQESVTSASVHSLIVGEVKMLATPNIAPALTKLVKYRLIDIIHLGCNAKTRVKTFSFNQVGEVVTDIIQKGNMDWLLTKNIATLLSPKDLLTPLCDEWLAASCCSRHWQYIYIFTWPRLRKSTVWCRSSSKSFKGPFTSLHWQCQTRELG